MIPDLNSLPKPPAGKTGWPWTEAPEILPNKMHDGSPWPMISIVTPSFNQGDYIEETIRSIILQGYPNLEYVVIDGGSTDNTHQVLEKYSSWISHCIIEKDNGQASAINKGLNYSHGDLMSWINSDDLLHWNALKTAALFGKKHDQMPFLAHGRRVYIDSESRVTKLRPGFCGQTNLNLIAYGLSLGIFQESSFWNRKAWDITGPLNENYYIGLDLDFFCRMLKNGVHPIYCRDYIGCWRKWGGTKCETKRDIVIYEDTQIREYYLNNFFSFLKNERIFRFVKKMFEICILSSKDTSEMPEIGKIMHIMNERIYQH